MKAINIVLKTIIYLPLYYLCRVSNAKNLIHHDLLSFRHHHNLNGSLYISYLQLFSDKYYRAVLYHRLGTISKLVSWYLPKESTFIIGSNCHIDGGILPAHSFATVLNAKTIGPNFLCRNNTTIGNKIDGRNDLVPIIGKNVTIGANCVVIGDIIIGDNVIIGAGSVVVKSVPSDCIVVGNPAKIVYNK